MSDDRYGDGEMASAAVHGRPWGSDVRWLEKEVARLRGAHGRQIVRVLFSGEGPDLTFVGIVDADGVEIAIGRWVEHEEFRALEIEVSADGASNTGSEVRQGKTAGYWMRIARMLLSGVCPACGGSTRSGHERAGGAAVVWGCAHCGYTRTRAELLDEIGGE